ncbi:MAG: response regulator [Chloroflexota bacterium]|nr:response regulator [Chloroflexota bacterium]
MLKRVFLVEDEIVTREGIRDNVDWASTGFEFCGEAPDGEMALPLIEATQPDVIITDIRMPFMDGLQLCKMVRRRMPEAKIIILSGHDEFEYAQEAVKLGVAEYLLKPVGVQVLQDTLKKVALKIEKERREKQSLRQLQEQVEENRTILRERFLLRLAMGAVSPSEALEKSQDLDLELVARCYLVVIFRIDLGHEQVDFFEYRQVRRDIAALVESNPDVFLFKKDLEELVLIVKGDKPEYLEQQGYLLTELIRDELNTGTANCLEMGIGNTQTRIGDIHVSFSQALAQLESGSSRTDHPDSAAAKAELLKLDKTAVADFLRCGVIEEFDAFFEAYSHPLSELAFKSSTVKSYVLVDLVLTTARFIRELGGSVDQVVPEINRIESLLQNTNSIETFKNQSRRILASALAFRDGRANSQYLEIIHQARAFIDDNHGKPNLSLNEVAAQVNLSPNHFSTVFSRETGETFKEYLTALKMRKAKELLRTTSLRSSEICFLVGYNDPHYFSHVFKKRTGLSPTEFRMLIQAEMSELR